MCILSILIISILRPLLRPFRCPSSIFMCSFFKKHKNKIHWLVLLACPEKSSGSQQGPHSCPQPPTAQSSLARVGHPEPLLFHACLLTGLISRGSCSTGSHAIVLCFIHVPCLCGNLVVSKHQNFAHLESNTVVFFLIWRQRFLYLLLKHFICFFSLGMEKLGVYQQDNWNFVSFLLVMENQLLKVNWCFHFSKINMSVLINWLLFLSFTLPLLQFMAACVAHRFVVISQLIRGIESQGQNISLSLFKCFYLVYLLFIYYSRRKSEKLYEI